MYSSNSNSNSSESSYDPRVTSFHTLSDPPPSYEFDNIAYNKDHMTHDLLQSDNKGISNKYRKTSQLTQRLNCKDNEE